MGPYGPFPQSPASGRYVANCSILSAAMNGVCHQLSSSCSRRSAGGAASGVAQHGCAAVAGPNYKRVCPSRRPLLRSGARGATIGWQGSCERTERQFARSGSALVALSPVGRCRFTIRFSFLPDHINQFAQLTSHGDLGLLLVGSAAMRQAVVQMAEVRGTSFASQDTARGLDEGPPQGVIASRGDVPAAVPIG